MAIRVHHQRGAVGDPTVGTTADADANGRGCRYDGRVIGAVVLLVLAILLVWRLAGRVFEHVLLNRGSRITWRDAASHVRPGR